MGDKILNKTLKRLNILLLLLVLVFDKSRIFFLGISMFIIELFFKKIKQNHFLL